MIKTWKKFFGYIISTIDWFDLFSGLMMMLLGLGLARHFGYRLEWSDFLRICIWFIFFKIAVYYLDAIFSGGLEQVLFKLINPDSASIRFQIRNLFLVFTIALLVVGFLPIYQLMDKKSLNELSSLLLTVIILGNLVFFIKELEQLLAGLNELVTAFTSAILLPALIYSLYSENMNLYLVFITLPLFLQILAWKLVNNLNLKMLVKRFQSASMIERIGPLNTLYVVIALVLISCLSLAFPLESIGIVNKLFILPVGMGAVWFTFKSIKVQKSNWEKATLLVTLLPFVTSLSMIFSLWLN